LGHDKEKTKRHLLTGKHIKALNEVLRWVSPESPERVRQKKRDMDHQREISQLMNVYFPNEHSGDPFFCYHFEKGEPGVKMLVGQANFHRCLGAGNVLDPYEVETDFLTACNFWELSQSQIQRFAHQQWRVYQLGRRHEKEDANGGCSTKRIIPPKDHNEVRKRYFRNENSIVPNLPVPIVRTHIPDHAFLDPIDCIRNQLAHGIPVEAIKIDKEPMSPDGSYDWITDTPRADELRELALHALKKMASEGKDVSYKVLILPQFVWQDDFDPNNSVKNNRFAMWAMTDTNAPPRNNRNSPLQTFCIALGKSKENSHAAVQDYFAKRFVDLAGTPTLLYSKIEGGGLFLSSLSSTPASWTNLREGKT
jgi:hypothetical protein